MTERLNANTIDDDALDALYAERDALLAGLDQTAADAARHRWCPMRENGILLRAERAEAAIERVRALHQPMERGGFVICSHCSGWNGVRCLGLVRDYPCDTLIAVDEPARDASALTDSDVKEILTGRRARPQPREQ